MVTETTKNAQNAAESAQAAERSSTAAKEAQTAAESAKAGAESAMKEVERDRVEVSETHKAVEQLRGAVDTDRQAVAADRRAVENTALQFGQFAQSAINAVGQAQEAAVQAVSAEGQRQTTAVQRAGTQAVSDVTAAKTEAVQAVTTEGDTQTKRVQDAAAGIVADREQIAANKAGIEALSQKKADAIIETAQGETMTLTDSSDKLFEGLRVFGKSTQDGAPSVENPVPIVNAGEGGSITVEVTGRNLLNLNDVTYSSCKKVDDNSVVSQITNKYFATITITTKNIFDIILNNKGKNAIFAINKGIENKAISILIYGTLSNGKSLLEKSSPNSGNVVVLQIPHELQAITRIELRLNRNSAVFTDTTTVIRELYLSVGAENLFSDYELYTHQSLTLATPNGLPGVPVSKDGNYTDQNGQQWVCDEIDLGREKYVQRVVIEKNSGGWELKPSSDTQGRFFQYNRMTNFFQAPLKTAVCNIANYVSWGSPTNDIYAFALNGNGIYFSPPKGVEITAEELNAKLNSLSFPVVVVGELATPIERDLTPEELTAYKALHTNYPTTVITNDAGAHMEASYVADTGTYIRNMESRLNAKLVNIQSALISQKISGGGIKVTDSSRVPVVRFAMWGKTEQRKTTGKNLIDIKGEITFSKGTFDIKDNLIDCTLADTWGGSYIMFSKEYPAGEYTFSADKMKNDTVQKIAILLTVEPLSYSVDSCAFNNYYKNYLIKNGKTLSRDITFKVDSPFEIGIPLSGDNDVVGETLSIKNIQLERGASATAYEPYSGGFPSPSPDWEQPIEITDQPVTVTIKGGTEQQSITLTPPKSMTKWDKLEKVDEVWCWVYQSKVLSGAEIKENFMGIHSSGSVMINISTLGVMDEQNDAVSDKFIYSTRSVATLKNGEFRIVYGNAYLKIDGVATAEEGKQWLESNDITIIAQASAPEFNPLSPSEQAQLNALTMYAPETEVTNTGGCNMELTYAVDTKSYVDSKIAAISAAVLEV